MYMMYIVLYVIINIFNFVRLSIYNPIITLVSLAIDAHVWCSTLNRFDDATGETSGAPQQNQELLVFHVVMAGYEAC